MVRNLIRQRAQLFKRLKVAETMRAYIAHNMNGNEELQAKLKVVEGELVDEGVGLLRKAEEGNEATEVEARRLAEEKEVLEADKRKAKEEAERLRQELQEL